MIVGGYNPYDWNDDFIINDKSPFTFHFYLNDLSNFTYNTVVNFGYGGANCGPEFGSDLKLLCKNTNKGQYLMRDTYSKNRKKFKFEI